MLNPKLKSAGKQSHCEAKKTNNNGQAEKHEEKKNIQSKEHKHGK